MTEKPRETQAELHVVELKEKVNNSSLMKHPNSTHAKDLGVGFRFVLSKQLVDVSTHVIFR